MVEICEGLGGWGGDCLGVNGGEGNELGCGWGDSKVCF